MRRAIASFRGAARLALASLVLGFAAVPEDAALAQTVACPRPLKPQLIAEMIFGRNIGEIEGAVDDEEWQRFLDEVVTPRFPDGLTVLDAAGQWAEPPARRVVREPAKVLLIVLTREAEQRPRLGEIAALYKRRFSQRSVIVMLRRACVTF
jgi:hypothetical protein